MVAVVTAIRVAIVDGLHDQGYFAKYLIFADRILAGHVPTDRLLDLSPLYLWITVAFRALKASFHAIRSFQIVLVSVAALLAALAARRFGTVATVAAAAFVLASRGALVCATEAEPETWILLFNCAALAVLMNNRRLRGGIWLGFSAICRPSAFLAAIVVAPVVRSWKLIAAAAAPIVIIAGVNLALTGELALMDPGTVFYEGMNPNASGYAGVQPRIVNDLERRSAEPDFMHVAYRAVAAEAIGQPVSRTESNRYWIGKSFAFVRSYPLAALRLTARKFYFALHSYEAYDLATMARKDIELARWPIFLPFGVIVGLAIMALVFRVPGIAPTVAFTLAMLFTLTLFYVTARQRNALIPGVAILAAAGLAEILRRGRILPAVAAAVIAILLSINGRAQKEDIAPWRGLENGFDRAIALEGERRWTEADTLLQQLDRYRPMRENRAVSSVAYYRAVAAAHMNRDPRALLDRAAAEAPGNEHVLAMRAIWGDRDASRLLYELHDPITARDALAAAK